VLAEHQCVVDLPRYATQLTHTLYRVNASSATFQTDDAPINVVTNDNFAKRFVDELMKIDPTLEPAQRIPFSTFIGLGFATSGDAVGWARGFVERFFPNLQLQLLKDELCSVPSDKTEIVWVGGDKHADLVRRIVAAMSPRDVADASDPVPSRRKKR
jgi:hypothetical protein